MHDFNITSPKTLWNYIDASSFQITRNSAKCRGRSFHCAVFVPSSVAGCSAVDTKHRSVEYNEIGEITASLCYPGMETAIVSGVEKYFLAEVADLLETMGKWRPETSLISDHSTLRR